ncbi:MAG TPA: hypothetical protein VF533_00055, partial [Solirubrobacteraceae bacterium]
ALVLAAVRDRDVARVFVGRAGGRKVSVYRGVDVVEVGAGVSAAVSDDVLLAGQAAGVRSAIDLQRGRGRALAGEPAFARGRIAGLDSRVVEAYATGAGARGVLAPLAGPLASLLSAGPDVEAIRAAVAPSRDGVRVRSRTVRRRGAPARAVFRPKLLHAAPGEAAGVLALASADPLVRRLPAAAPGLAAAARAAGVDVERDLLAPLRGGEVVVWATRGDPVPGVALAARTRDPARTREALGRLQGAVAAQLAPGEADAGQVPLFEQREIAGVPAFVLRLAPGAQLVYAVFGDTVVLATGPDAIERVRRGGARKRIGIPANGVEAVLFIEPGQLLALGDLLGVTADPAVQAVRDDVSRIRAVSAVAQREETDTTAELLFQIP